MRSIKLFIIFSFISFSLVTQAQYELLETDVTFSNGEITSYTNTTERDIIIPDNFDGVSVTSIGDHGFFGYQLTSIRIPNTVVEIGYQAFASNQLDTVIIPTSGSFIRSGAFKDNPLSGFILPSPSISGAWSRGSSGGTVYNMEEEYVYLASNFHPTDEYFLFENGVILGYYGPGGVVTIPALINGDSVTSIGDNAFSHNELDSLIIPNAVTSIGESAFYNNNLSSITIPNFVTFIGASAFNSNELDSITIPNSVTTIGGSVFSSNRLTSLTIPGSVTSIGNYAFSDNQLTSVTIPNSVTSIEGFAFYGNQLDSVTVPNSVNSIGWRVFQDNQLTYFKLPDHYQGYEHTWNDTYSSGDTITNLSNSYDITDRGALYDFSIAFALDGGEATNPTSYTVEDATIVLANAVKDSCDFEGWYTDSTFNTEITEITAGSFGDLELFAKYAVISGLSMDYADNRMKVYSNPSSNFVNFDFGDYLLLDGYSMRITDALGVIQYDELISEQSESIDLSSTLGGAGLYLIYILDGNQEIKEVKKMVVQ